MAPPINKPPYKTILLLCALLKTKCSYTFLISYNVSIVRRIAFCSYMKKAHNTHQIYKSKMRYKNKWLFDFYIPK